ncbi:peptidoglycan-binding domain-containing protein [Defluviimonas salinarum]|uniref:Peptidoglycan-binding protein n=1 Tax=Defluviimonas salinarum TaxID=2992147 RepID=A0ABT3J7E6_9RHOB|nr:peptidoglycan-binding domain-containing protein [Defluviimonas salinarum]MCW3783593.1 peptidoglycan-binding protein [Defluviimonas salinarum]
MKSLAALLLSAALATGTAAPVQAGGKDLAKGLAVIAVMTAIAKSTGGARAATPSYGDGGYGRNTYGRNTYSHGAYDRSVYQDYQDPEQASGQAFMSLSPLARRSIEERLARYGYETGRIDGRWDQATWFAVQDYARDVRMSRSLGSQDGAMGVFHHIVS